MNGRTTGNILFISLIAMGATTSRAGELSFKTQEIDSDVKIGYGLGTGDVDGDGKVDILLADQKEFVWYRNPDWKRFVLWANPAKRDNVCLAVRDIDGDGKVEIAAGAEWAPGDTVGSGSVHYLQRPTDPTKPWKVFDLPREPTVHRMRWVKTRGGYELVVAPLHGRGNRGGQGEGVRVYAYAKPDDASGPWRLELVDGGMHVLHNLDPVNFDDDPEEEILLAGREGVFVADRVASRWVTYPIAGNRPGESVFKGCSEVRLGTLPGGGRFVATIEAFHGSSLVAYMESAGHGLWGRHVIDTDLDQGHAIAAGDLDGNGGDELVVGWRGARNSRGKVGVNIYNAESTDGKNWSTLRLDEGEMACEDLRLADLDGDKRLDIIAAGRASHNLRIYWNRTAK